MGYYWITEAQRYIQRLGFNSKPRQQPPAAAAHQPVRRRQLLLPQRHEQAHDHPRQGRRRRRRGRRRDRPRVRPLGAGRPGAGLRLHTRRRRDRRGLRRLPGRHGHAAVTPQSLWPCVADWDSVSYTRTTPHCLRRTDGTKHYPADLVGEVHADGEIWSLGALSDEHGARRATGRPRSSSARSSASPRRSRCPRPPRSPSTTRARPTRRPCPRSRRPSPPTASAPRSASSSRAHAPLQREDGHARGRKRS